MLKAIDPMHPMIKAWCLHPKEIRAAVRHYMHVEKLKKLLKEQQEKQNEETNETIVRKDH